MRDDHVLLRSYVVSLPYPNYQMRLNDLNNNPRLKTQSLAPKDLKTHKANYKGNYLTQKFYPKNSNSESFIAIFFLFDLVDSWLILHFDEILKQTGLG